MPIEEALKTLLALVATYALSAIGGIAILIAGWLIAGWASRTTERVLGRVPRIDGTLVGFLASVVRYGVLALVGVAVLNQFGVQTASIIAIFGATGLAIGLALQGTLSHLAAGAMLLLFRPFTTGDLVQLGSHRGHVRELNMFTTHLDTLDNVRVILPNGKVWGDIIQNLSTNPRLRVAASCVVPWTQDLEKARAAVLKAAAETPGMAADAAPTVSVTVMDAAGATLRVEAWAEPAHADRATEALGWQIARAVDALRRDAAGRAA
ncbi:mechanosensitive ion channel family protein [Vineibacter terrae]|uniref:mechanosensitive ion channel family protein n=1 Tax=Vineibacter terrae TaxID=2586908 RepID=UPI002E2F6A87|nr:mechanosensitive ion channel domain-containing protein [Vineibacter terrae]HEX2887846.1 mechanosensitive ion channel domain-containing protein [Vineibacter terrae]